MELLLVLTILLVIFVLYLLFNNDNTKSLSNRSRERFTTNDDTATCDSYSDMDSCIDSKRCAYMNDQCVDCSASNNRLECNSYSNCSWLKQNDTTGSCLSCSSQNTQEECGKLSECYWLGNKCSSVNNILKEKTLNSLNYHTTKLITDTLTFKPVNVEIPGEGDPNVYITLTSESDVNQAIFNALDPKLDFVSTLNATAEQQDKILKAIVKNMKPVCEADLQKKKVVCNINVEYNEDSANN